MATETKTKPETALPPPSRCTDCDADCWDVHLKTNCWVYDPDKGFCPWLHPGIEFPPKN